MTRASGRGPPRPDHPVASSSGSNVRPCIAGTPSTLKNPPVTCAPGNCSAAPRPVSANALALMVAISVKLRLSRRQSVKSGGETLPPARSGARAVVENTCTSSSGAGNGSGRSSTARTALKMAAFPPMPTASVRIVIVANPGLRTSVRTAYLMSCSSISSLHRSQRSQAACTHAPAHRATSRAACGRARPSVRRDREPELGLPLAQPLAPQIGRRQRRRRAQERRADGIRSRGRRHDRCRMGDATAGSSAR